MSSEKHESHATETNKIRQKTNRNRNVNIKETNNEIALQLKHVFICIYFFFVNSYVKLLYAGLFF